MTVSPLNDTDANLFGNYAQLDRFVLNTAGVITPFGGGTYNVYQNDCCIGDFYFPEDTFEGTCAGASCCITMDTVCRITTNADVTPNTQIDLHALF